MSIYFFDDAIIDPTVYPWGYQIPFAWSEFLPEEEDSYPFEFYNTIVSVRDDSILSFERQFESLETKRLDAEVDRYNRTALKVIARADTLGDPSSRMKAQIYINDSLEIDIPGDQTTFTTYTIDVSGLGETFILGLGYESTNHGSSAKYLAEFADYWLE